MLVPAPLALKAREPAGEEPASAFDIAQAALSEVERAQEAFELGLHETRQPTALTHPLGPGAECLVVLAHDLIQDALGRRPRLVLGRSGHARDRREGRATHARC
jgi:hypothetical protein